VIGAAPAGVRGNRAPRVGHAAIALALAAALTGLVTRAAPAGACLVELGEHPSGPCIEHIHGGHFSYDELREGESEWMSAPPLTKEELLAGFALAMPGVWACGRSAHRHGVVVMDVGIGRTGTINLVNPRGAFEGTALAVCIERAIRGAPIRFRPARELRISYAFVLDPPAGTDPTRKTPATAKPSPAPPPPPPPTPPKPDVPPAGAAQQPPPPIEW